MKKIKKFTFWQYLGTSTLPPLNVEQRFDAMSLMIRHFSHHHHLALRCSQRPFQCDGCKELGFGACYQCEHPNCFFFLHDACAEASPTAFHPFFNDITFKFFSHPSNGIVPCDACGNTIQGFHYNSQVVRDVDIPFLSSIDFHPVCLKLKYVLQSDDGLTLHLRDKVSYSRYHLSSILRKKCQHCNSTELSKWLKGWAYVSSDGNYRYHVACVRDMMYDKWKTSYFQGQMVAFVTNGASPLSIMAPSGSSSQNTAVAQQHNNSSGTGSMFLRMTKVVIRLIISAIFGEPTGIFFAAAEIFRNH